MDDEVQSVALGIAAPGLVDRGKGCIYRGDILDIAGQDQLRADALGERLDALAERLALIGEGHLRAMGVQGARDAPGDRVLVGDAHDEAALVVHQGEHDRRSMKGETRRRLTPNGDRSGRNPGP